MLKQAIVAVPKPENVGRIHVPATTAITLIVAAGIIVVLGLFPSIVLGLF